MINITNDRTPYTYLIGWSKLNKWYYGVRFAKNCHPNDLWVKYFTSSKLVKKFVKDNGNPDIIKVRKTFNNIDKARLYEHKVLRRLRVNFRTDFINKSIGLGISPMPGDKNPFYGKKHSIESCNKISKAIKGRKDSKETRLKKKIAMTGENHPKYGKKHTEETIDKMRKVKLGKTVIGISLVTVNPYAYEKITDKSFLIESIKMGKSAGMIAKELGINASTVIRYGKKLNITFIKNTEHPIEMNVIEKLSNEKFLIDCINLGKTTNIIAEELNVSGSTVLRYAKKLAVKFPRKPRHMSVTTANKLSDKQFFLDCKNKKLTFNDIANSLGDVSANIVGRKYRKLFTARYQFN